MARQKRIWRESQHPRDSRGRFAKRGGTSWAKRASAEIAAQPGSGDTRSAAGRPRISRQAKAGVTIQAHLDGGRPSAVRVPQATKTAAPKVNLTGFMAKGLPTPKKKAAPPVKNLDAFNAPDPPKPVKRTPRPSPGAAALIAARAEEQAPHVPAMTAARTVPDTTPVGSVSGYAAMKRHTLVSLAKAAGIGVRGKSNTEMADALAAHDVKVKADRAAKLNPSRVGTSPATDSDEVPEAEVDEIIRAAGMYPDEFESLASKRQWLADREKFFGPQRAKDKNDAGKAVADLSAKLRALELERETASTFGDSFAGDEDEQDRAKKAQRGALADLNAKLVEAQRAERGWDKPRSKTYGKLSDAALDRAIKDARPGTQKAQALKDERDARAAERFKAARAPKVQVDTPRANSQDGGMTSTTRTPTTGRKQIPRDTKLRAMENQRDGGRGVVARHRALTRAEFDALPEAERTRVLQDLRQVARSKEEEPYTIPSNRSSMGMTVRSVREAAHVKAAKEKLRELTYTAPPPVDNSTAGRAERLKAGDRWALEGATMAELDEIGRAAGYGGITPSWKRQKAVDYLRNRAAAGDRLPLRQGGPDGLADALRGATPAQALAILDVIEADRGVTLAEMKAAAKALGGKLPAGDKRRTMHSLAALAKDALPKADAAPVAAPARSRISPDAKRGALANAREADTAAKRAASLEKARQAQRDERRALLNRTKDPKDNSAKIKAIEDGTLDSADLYRTAMTGPSGQRAPVHVGRVRHTPDRPEGEFEVTSTGGDRAGWATRVSRNGETVYAVHSENYDGERELLGWADTLAHAADVLTNGEAAASTGGTLDARRISGRLFERNPSRGMPLDELELSGARDAVRRARESAENPNLIPAARERAQRELARREADLQELIAERSGERAKAKPKLTPSEEADLRAEHLAASEALQRIQGDENSPRIARMRKRVLDLEATAREHGVDLKAKQKKRQLSDMSDAELNAMVEEFGASSPFSEAAREELTKRAPVDTSRVKSQNGGMTQTPSLPSDGSAAIADAYNRNRYIGRTPEQINAEYAADLKARADRDATETATPASGAAVKLTPAQQKLRDEIAQPDRRLYRKPSQKGKAQEWQLYQLQGDEQREMNGRGVSPVARALASRNELELVETKPNGTEIWQVRAAGAPAAPAGDFGPKHDAAFQVGATIEFSHPDVNGGRRTQGTIDAHTRSNDMRPTYRVQAHDDSGTVVTLRDSQIDEVVGARQVPRTGYVGSTGGTPAPGGPKRGSLESKIETKKKEVERRESAASIAFGARTSTGARIQSTRESRANAALSKARSELMQLERELRERDAAAPESTPSIPADLAGGAGATRQADGTIRVGGLREGQQWVTPSGQVVANPSQNDIIQGRVKLRQSGGTGPGNVPVGGTDADSRTADVTIWNKETRRPERTEKRTIKVTGLDKIRNADHRATAEHAVSEGLAAYGPEYRPPVIEFTTDGVDTIGAHWDGFGVRVGNDRVRIHPNYVEHRADRMAHMVRHEIAHRAESVLQAKVEVRDGKSAASDWKAEVDRAALTWLKSARQAAPDDPRLTYARLTEDFHGKGISGGGVPEHEAFAEVVAYLVNGEQLPGDSSRLLELLRQADPNFPGVRQGGAGVGPGRVAVGGTDAEVETAIQEAYTRIAGRMVTGDSGYVKIADVRRILGERYDRQTVDRVLDKMIERPDVTMYAEPQPAAITAADRAAAVEIGGEDRHVIRIESRSTSLVGPGQVAVGGTDADRRAARPRIEGETDRAYEVRTAPTREAALSILNGNQAAGLRAIARAEGIVTSGSKADLVARLIRVMRDRHEDSAAIERMVNRDRPAAPTVKAEDLRTGDMVKVGDTWGLVKKVQTYTGTNLPTEVQVSYDGGARTEWVKLSDITAHESRRANTTGGPAPAPTMTGSQLLAQRRATRGN